MSTAGQNNNDQHIICTTAVEAAVPGGVMRMCCRVGRGSRAEQCHLPVHQRQRRVVHRPQAPRSLLSSDRLGPRWIIHRASSLPEHLTVDRKPRGLTHRVVVPWQGAQTRAKMSQAKKMNSAQIESRGNGVASACAAKRSCSRQRQQLQREEAPGSWLGPLDAVL